MNEVNVSTSGRGTWRKAPSVSESAVTRQTIRSVGSNVILLAEDDQDTQDLLIQFLKKAGYEVLPAADGEQVLEIIEHEIPALFLLDGEMPKLDGFSVCERLKADPRFSDIPVIFLTVLSDTGHKTRGFEVGGSDYVTKPVEKIELLARVESHLELARRRKTLEHKALLLEGIVENQCERLQEVRSGQESLLTEASQFKDVGVAVRFQPAHEAGGDFYEIARLADGEFGFLVFDVSGHDLSVPFITGALKALSATFMNESLTPPETMMLLNAGLLRFLSIERYVTACYARFSRPAMEVELVNAGHPPALYQTLQGETRYVEIVGDVLGMFDQVQFGTRCLAVQPGDRLFLYSDGLIEGYLDPQGRAGRAKWGMERLRSAIGARRSLPLARAVNETIDELLDERGGKVDDDVVMLGIEF